MVPAKTSSPFSAASSVKGPAFVDVPLCMDFPVWADAEPWPLGIQKRVQC